MDKIILIVYIYIILYYFHDTYYFQIIMKYGILDD